MPKVKVTDYISTLQALVVNVPANEREENFAGFLKLLQHHKQLGLLDQILDGLRERLQRENGGLTATLHVSADPTAAQLQSLETFLCDHFQVTSIDWITKKDHNSPGVIVDAGGYRFDWSLAHQLTRFQTCLQAI